MGGGAGPPVGGGRGHRAWGDAPRTVRVKPGRGEAAASPTRGQPGKLLGCPELRLELGGFGVTLLTAGEKRAGEKQVEGGLGR